MCSREHRFRNYSLVDCCQFQTIFDGQGVKTLPGALLSKKVNRDGTFKVTEVRFSNGCMFGLW
jgi:hypothetical protein